MVSVGNRKANRAAVDSISDPISGSGTFLLPGSVIAALIGVEISVMNNSKAMLGRMRLNLWLDWNMDARLK